MKSRLAAARFVRLQPVPKLDTRGFFDVLHMNRFRDIDAYSRPQR